MLEWLWPWMFVLLPLPLLARRMTARSRPKGAALRYPLYRQLVRMQSDPSNRSLSQFMPLLLAFLIWLMLVAAAARPTWIGEPVPVAQAGRDLMLIVDISPSMREADMQWQNSWAARMDVVKAVVGDFVSRRRGDRLGLVLFGEQSFLQTPLTFDLVTVEQQLREAQPGFAGNATAIGDAIGIAILRLRDRPSESRVAVLLTDGANNAGANPRDAARVAAEAGIRIHTIAVTGDRRQTTNMFGITRTMNPADDIDEAALRYVAETTSGQYFHANNPQQLIEVHRLIDRLEPIPEDLMFRPQRSLFHWPLGIAALMAIGAIVLSPLRRLGVNK